MDVRSTDLQIFFYRLYEPVGKIPCTRHVALIYEQASAKKSWHTGKTLMGLKDSLHPVAGIDWEAVEEELLAVGHYNCVAVAERYDFVAPLIR